MPAGESGPGSDTERVERSVERFLGEPTRELGDWRWLWDGDRRFPLRSHRGVLGRLIVAFKRLLRPFVAAPQADLWERQRVFNLILLEYLQRGEDVRHVVLDLHQKRLDHLEAVWREGLAEVMGHNDALFAHVDQKLDHLRRESLSVWARLAGAVSAAESGGPAALARVREEQDYLELERRFRGTESEIHERMRPYLGLLEGRGEVLDLGCGRGEALAVLGERGIEARGIDASASMVEECRRKGLRAEAADLFEALAAVREASLGGVVSFHVIEHLEPRSIERLVHLAWRALRPGGVLVLETPNPLSLVVAARNFWIDPTHRRPVHPETLRLQYEVAGFDPVERIDLRPFPAEQRLPEIDPLEVAGDLRPLAHRVNELRDRLDDLLWGAQDYALVGTRPA
ncbi:MAG TPA: class I SAM-dependent methyltransferase [Thermoanaerobaculia bacterium]|nr:class I SAM-dependent methyltransferase [Thermoanaerobaculia bacterium]